MLNLKFFLANVKSNIKLGIKLVEKKNGKTFIEITDHRVNLTFGAVKLHFSNLFNGNKELGKYFQFIFGSRE